MNIELKEYQETAVGQLVDGVSGLVRKSAENAVCVFQAPTGSGKTVMVAKFIERLISELADEDLCFLWLSVGKGDLHKQSKRSLDKIFEGAPKCVLVEEEYSGARNIISHNEVVVANWEKLWHQNRQGEWTNQLMRDGEKVNLIETLQNTKEKRKIISIIDESHYAADTDRTNALREIVNADVTLEMSATPKMFGEAFNILRGMPSPVNFSETGVYVYVRPTEVIAEGMIKKQLIINEGLDELAEDEMTSEQLILEAAYQKRAEQKGLFEAIGSDVNPLCIVQLPTAELGAEKRERVEAFLSEKGVTEKNGKLAIWLSGEKSEDIDEISKKDNKIEFLIFKQAIDTGWDCPRASILVKLREIQSPTFEIQTVGRILRMPELMHYEKETLNTGNIYTNLTSITVKNEEYNPNIIKVLKAERKEVYQPLGLTSYFKSRVDYGDITRSFVPVLHNAFRDGLGLNDNFALFAENVDKLIASGMTFEASDYEELIYENVVVATDKFDDIVGELGEAKDERLKLKLSDADVQNVFDQVIKHNLNGFAPKRSIPNVRGAIYHVFKNYFGIDRYSGGAIKIQRIFLHPNNVGRFSGLLGTATNAYRPLKKAEARTRITEEYYDWEIKEVEYYNEHTDVKLNYAKCIYEPCYLKADRSNPEKDFELYLENNAQGILWWCKNGERSKDYFGVRYVKNDMPETFYPDYIIQFESGKVGIFDTKAGQTAEDAKLKAEALTNYIVEQKTKGKDIVGGIIVQDRNGHWLFNQEAEYSYDPNDLTDWDRFDDFQ